MKEYISIIASVSIFLTVVSPVSAIRAIPRDQAVLNASISAQRQEQIKTRIESKGIRLNDRAGLEIDRRVASLNKLISKINEIKRITSSQKSKLISQVRVEISSLMALKEKIKTDTDPVALKADVQSIVKSYKVYRLFMPKIQVLAAADRILNVADEMSSLSAKLQTRVDTSKTEGKDVTSLQTLLVDMNLKIADAKKDGLNAIDAVLQLTPESISKNSSIFISARKLIHEGKQKLVDAHHDAQKIISGLRDINKPANASPSVPSVTVEPIKSKPFKNHTPAGIKSKFN